MNSRLTRVIQSLEKASLDAILINSRPNIKYLSGFHAEDAWLLVFNGNQPAYFTDFRLIEDAKRSLPNFSIVDIKANFAKTIAETINSLNLKRIGFEARIMPYAEYALIKKHLGKSKLIPIAELVETLRQVKDEAELKLIRKAVKITNSGFTYFKNNSREFIGKSEKQASDTLENYLRAKGAECSGFETIVAVGANSSYPHARCTTQKIQANSQVLIDMGAKFHGYNSDLTRMFFLGKIPTSLQRKVFDIVKTANSLAINKIRPGVPISEIDKAARGYIARKGFGEYFGHSLGHGVGLEVHEKPRISGKNEDLLQEGMVFTIEPGIYLPGKFGVRLEETVLVTSKGAEVLK